MPSRLHWRVLQGYGSVGWRLTPSVPSKSWERRYKKSTTCLMSIKQREDEMLRSYITRFNKEALLIDEVDDKILVATFTNKLRKGKFLFSLYKKDSKTMSDVLYWATKYLNAKDALLAQKEKPKKRERQEDTWQDRGQKMTRVGDRQEDRRFKPPRWKICILDLTDCLYQSVPNADQGWCSLDVAR